MRLHWSVDGVDILGRRWLLAHIRSALVHFIFTAFLRRGCVLLILQPCLADRLWRQLVLLLGCGHCMGIEIRLDDPRVRDWAMTHTLAQFWRGRARDGLVRTNLCLAR